MSEVAMAYERVPYLNIGTQNATGGYDASGNNWVLMGEGFTALDENMNPQVDEAKYIHMAAASKSIVGYAPEWAYNGDVIKNNAVVTFLRNVSINNKVGNDAEAEVLFFDAWDVSESDTVAATKYRIAIKADTGSGIEGGSKLKLKGSLLGKGDPVQGTFNVSTSTFTASA